MKVNGKLVFDASSASVIENLRLERYSTNPTATATDVGRLIYNTTNDTVYVGVEEPSSTYMWVAIATGGNAAAIQTELDNVESALGAGVTSAGVFNADGFTDVTGILVDPTSFTDAINQLAASVNANNTLAELDDVTLTAPASNDLLQYNGSVWVNRSIGTTSGVQAYDAGLDALAAFNTNGILVQTANNTFAGRTLVAPAAGITITDANGVAGNPTFALANDLAALEGLATTGYIVRTGDGTAVTRAIAGTAGRITVTNGDGVATDTNVDLTTLTDTGTGTFLKLTRDAYGRVEGTTAVVAADITALVDATYVNVTGDSMSGTLTMTGAAQVVLPNAPTLGTHATNKNYVDALSAGLTWKTAVRAATTAAGTLATDFENGDTLDGVTLATGDRILIKNQAAPEENGIYLVAASGAPTRTTDMDAAVEFSSATVFVQNGTVNADTGWTQTATVTTLGTDPVVFTQFTGAGTYVAGDGLVLTGNTFAINMGAGIVSLPSDEVGIHLYDSATGAIILTENGTSRSTAAASMLHLLLAGSGGLTQDATGLYIGAGAVTNAMLVNSGFTLNGDTGTDVVSLGNTILFAGSATQGISTAITDNTVTISAVNASTTQKGVASFDTSHFSVTSGAVSLAASLDDLTNVSTADAAATNSLLQKSAGDWVAVTPAAVGGTILLGDLSDVGTATPTDGHALIGDGSVWANQKIYHLHDEASPAATWTVAHGLGQRYCNVTVVDATNNVVIPESIVFDSTTQLTVTFNTAIAGKVVVMGIA